jgi:hypothetical protein
MEKAKGKSGQKSCSTSAIFENLHKVSNRPLGENSPQSGHPDNQQSESERSWTEDSRDSRDREWQWVRQRKKRESSIEPRRPGEALKAFLRPVFNNMVCPQGWSLPLGVNLAHRGELCPLGECSPLCSPPGVNTLYCLEEWRAEQRISPPGDNLTPRGQDSFLGDNFAHGGQSLPPRGDVKNGPEGTLLAEWPDEFVKKSPQT